MTVASEFPAAKLGMILILLAGLGACGGSGSGEASVPSSGGDVWEIDQGNRAMAAGAVLAYVNGLHVLVLDDGEVSAGMTPVKTAPKPDGGLNLKLESGVEATLTPAAADRLELRFASGESVSMRKKQTAGGTK
jgi:hypothetical protein